MPSGHRALIQLGGTQAVGLFVVCLFAFVAETQLSQVSVCRQMNVCDALMLNVAFSMYKPI